MSYYIDGYNLLFYLLDSHREDVELARRDLVDVLSFSHIKGIVFFDDRSDLSTEKPSCCLNTHLRVLFSPRGLCADKYILEMLHAEKTPDHITVVTSDKHLANHAKFLGAKTETSSKFAQRLKPRFSCEKKPTSETPRRLRQLEKLFEKEKE